MKSRVTLPTTIIEQDFWKEEAHSKCKILLELFIYTTDSNISVPMSYLEKKYGLSEKAIIEFFNHPFLKKHFTISKEDLMGLHEIKRKGKSVVTPQEEEDLTKAIELGKLIINKFNEEFGTNYKDKHAEGIAKNVLYWMDFYSEKEMLESISRARRDAFWCDKMTPILLCRRRNPKGEDVDYMGNLLNKKRRLQQETAIGRAVELS